MIIGPYLNVNQACRYLNLHMKSYLFLFELKYTKNSEKISKKSERIQSAYEQTYLVPIFMKKSYFSKMYPNL